MNKPYKLNNYPIDSPSFKYITLGSGVVLIQDGKILLVRETNNDPYSFPGGAVEGYESIEQTAIREVKEELNLNVELEDNPYIFSFVRRNKAQENELVVLFHFAAKKISGDLILGTDAKQMVWKGLGDNFTDSFENVPYALQYFLSNYGPRPSYKIKRA